jgi:class 3 adenylate cyclase/tetratricopeptide (TPR) repeat protein
MPDLPRGTVSFLFTDIEGSTRLWERHRAVMGTMVDRHLALLRGAIEAHQGVLFKVVGDAVQAAFPTAPSAVAAALDAQRALLADDWGALGALPVRMAVHTGEAVPDEQGDYRAAPLNRLSRLLAAGHGRQILLTQTVQQLTRGALPEGSEVRDLGEHRLRDLVDPERVFQLTHPDLPSAFPALRTPTSGTQPLAHQPAPPEHIPVPASSLVGREGEQATLRGALTAAIAGRGGLVLLGGEAGIGKTTLAKDLAKDAEARGTAVLTGHCYDLTNTPPYGPWLDLIASYSSEPGLPPPPAVFAGGRVEQVTDQAALFAEVRRFFAELSRVRPSLVVLEDLHWSDPASLDLLRHMAPHVRHWPLLLLVTYRIDELTRRHPFSRQLPALVREAEGLRLDLQRLDADALHELIATRYPLPAEDAERLVTYLQEHAEGNPFFATELLRALQEEALLRQGDDGWTLGALDRVVVPTFLRQVIDGRIARLGEDVRQPLAVAAVIGQHVAMSLWAEVAELDDEALLAIVEQAVEAHLLDAERDGLRVRFTHALTREALYEGVLPLRRRIWHRRIAETLMSSVEPDPDDVAYHLQQSGDARAWAWLVQAADRAQRAYAWLTATERLRAATALLAGIEGQEQTHRRLVSRLAYLKRFSDPAGAIEALDEAERLASRVGDDQLSAELHSTRGYLLCYSDHFVAGLKEIARGLDALEAMPLEPAQIPALVQTWLAETVPGTVPVDMAAAEQAVVQLRAAGFHFRRCWHPWFLASAGQTAAAITMGERYVEALAEAPKTHGGIRTSTAFTHHGLAIAYATLGRPDQAAQAWSQARELFRVVDHHALTAFTALNELRDLTLTYGGADPAARHRLAAEGEAALARAGGALRPGVTPRLAWLGCLVVDGRWTEALRILDDLPAPGNAYLRREVTAAQVLLGRDRGEPERAWKQIRALLPAGPASEPGDIIFQEGLLLLRVASDLCVDAGDLALARCWLEAHDRWLGWNDSVLGQAEGRLAWARYHAVAGNTDDARAGGHEALGLAATPDQPFVRIAAHRLLGEVETGAGMYAEAETHLAAARILVERCEAPFERSQTLLALAELRRATGQRAEADALLGEIRVVCASLGAIPTLRRAEAPQEATADHIRDTAGT